jgi:nicotinate-nucleotide pyrophosphorylase
MAKYHVTIANVSHLEVEAESEEEARKKADAMLDELTIDEMQEVYDRSTGWEITDIGTEDESAGG